MAQIMFLITLASELFLCSGGVVGEATPGVPRLPLSQHRTGAGPGEPESFRGSTAGLASEVFFPGVHIWGIRVLTVPRPKAQCWRLLTGRGAWPHYLLAVWIWIRCLLWVEWCPPHKFIH